MKEADIQKACIKWFRYQYPGLLLFAVPNGGTRNPIEAAHLKAQGVLPGVADLILLYPSNGYHGMVIELKTPQGRIRPAQTEFLQKAREHDYLAVICRSLDEFVNSVNLYLNPENNKARTDGTI